MRGVDKPVGVGDGMLHGPFAYAPGHLSAREITGAEIKGEKHRSAELGWSGFYSIRAGIQVPSWHKPLVLSELRFIFDGPPVYQAGISFNCLGTTVIVYPC